MKNESGYALLTVLLTVVIIMVVGLAFFSQSSNSIKQNKNVETKSQSIALAEMGVEYFYQKASNSYQANLPLVESEIKEKIEDDRKNNKLKTPEEYKSETIKLMIEKLDVDLNTLQGEQVANEASFSINSYSANETNNGIEITYNSIGIEKGKSTGIDGTLTISMDVEEKGNSNGVSSLPDFNSIKKPENVKSICKNPSEIKRECSEILIDGGFDRDFKNEGNSLEDILIYSNSKIEFKNANSVNNIKIHSNGFGTEKNMNEMKDSIIESINSVKIGSQLRMINTKLLVDGALHVNGHLDINNRSFVYVTGSATVDKHMIIDSGSKVCVRGALSVYGNKLDVDGELYVRGPIGSINELPKNAKQYVSDAEFAQKCSTSSSSHSIIWDEDMNRSIEYNY